MQDVRDRLLSFISYMGLTKQAFEKQIGLSNGTVTKTKRLGDDKIDRILSKFPQLNKVWLLTGEGEMLNFSVYGGTPTTVVKGDDCVEHCDVEEIPVIPRNICNEPGIDVLQYIKQNDVNKSPVVLQFPTTDMWFPVFTDTMSPDYLPGDKVGLYAYPQGEEEILNNRTYVIDTRKNGLILCRLSRTTDGYIARYRNSDYPNDFIRLDDVIRIYKVVGLLRVIM